MIAHKRDSRIKTAVLRELRADTRVNETEIGVAVEDGVVTLTGRVGTEGEKAAASGAAHRAAGVRDVANDIVVKVPFALGRADADLAHAVRAALERDAPVAAPHVRSTVYDAVVTLEGMVDDRHDREAAERAVRRVAGVRQVVDRIAEIDRLVSLPALRSAIEEALERRAERNAGRLELMVDHGVVTVEGRVDSTSDKHAVLELVRHAPAVRGVRDRLRVGP